MEGEGPAVAERERGGIAERPVGLQLRSGWVLVLLVGLDWLVLAFLVRKVGWSRNFYYFNILLTFKVCSQFGPYPLQVTNVARP